jgi:hypothetical protein
MKSTITRKATPVSADIRELVANLVMSAAAEYEPGEADTIIDKAVERITAIEAAGLKVCSHPNGELRGFVLTTLDLDPYTIGQHIDTAVGAGYYVNSDYYGKEDSLKTIDHGFTEADLGSVFFVVEAVDIDKMPGHNSDIPGSICANMRWSKDRDDKFTAFAAEFAAAGEVRAVNYLSHSLIYLHDLNRQLYGSTLGKVGYVDYIQQKYDIDTGLCPYGYVNDDGPKWDACNAEAYSDCAAVCLVR